MLRRHDKKLYLILIFIFLLVLIIKANTLSAPLFEDAKFFTVPIAIYTAENGFPITVREGLPKHLETSNEAHGMFNRGIPDSSHTFMFYYILAAFYVTFGYSIIISHLIVLIFGIICLFYIYKLIYLLTKESVTALAGMLLVLSNPFFFTQLGRLDISIAVNAFIFMSIYYYFKSDSKRFVISSSLMLLTKESSVLVLTLIISHWIIEKIYHHFKKKKFNSNIKFKHFSIPAGIIILWFIIYKLIQGHFVIYMNKAGITLANLNIHTMIFELMKTSKFMFITQYKFILLVGILFALTFYKRFSKEVKRFLLLAIMIIVVQVIFYTFMFQISTHARYILPAIITFTILFSISTFTLIKNKKIVLIFVVIFLALSATTYFGSVVFNNDENMTYFEVVKIKQEAVAFINTELPENYTLWVDGFTYADFSYKFIGYIDEELKVKMIPSAKDKPINLSVFKKGDYITKCSHHAFWQKVDKTRETVNALNISLVKKFESKKHYFHIYVIN